MADLDIIGAASAEVGALLVVIHPVQSYLGAGVDPHRAEEVRPVLDGLGTLAREAGCAILILRQLRESVADAAIDRGWGSLDFGATARCVLLAGADPADPARRALVALKHSRAAEPPAIGYAIETATIAAGIETARIRWTGDTDMTAATILGAEPMPERPEREDTSSRRAEGWLRTAPAGGRRAPWDALTREGRAAGHAEHTLRRARQALGCCGARGLRGVCVVAARGGRRGPAPPVNDGQTSQSASRRTPSTAPRFAQAGANGQTSEAMSHKGGEDNARFTELVGHGGAPAAPQTSPAPGAVGMPGAPRAREEV